MEVVALIGLAVLVLDPGLIRGLFTPRKVIVTSQGNPAGQASPTGGAGVNTYNGGPGPTQPGAGVTPSGAQQPTGASGSSGIAGYVGAAGSALGSIMGALGFGSTGNHSSGAPVGSQPNQFDPYSSGGKTSTSPATGSDASFSNNNTDGAATGDYGPTAQELGSTGDSFYDNSAGVNYGPSPTQLGESTSSSDPGMENVDSSNFF